MDWMLSSLSSYYSLKTKFGIIDNNISSQNLRWIFHIKHKSFKIEYEKKKQNKMI